ncbi:MAG: tail fiber domain-containing protein, partial [Taibaiella sp.]|nr:tail fiber domain-containing protein [Taibaiella sp.]
VIISTTPGVTSVSDKKFKEDIHDLEGTMEKIMMLEPKSYLFKDEKEFPSFSFPQGTQFGFIAQDLEKIFPELVEESVNPAQYDDDGKMIADKVTFKGVEYTSLIPVLTAGIQEQQKMIEEKNVRIDELEERIARLEEKMNNNGTDIDYTGNDKKVSEAILFQNTPNPFNGNTEIRYRLPENYTHADVMIFDMNGKKIRSIALQGSEGYVTVSAHDLAAGMYMYSLVLDGEIAATKRMLVNK